MVGIKKKKKQTTSLPQLKIGGIYHSDLYSDSDRKGHFVVIAKIISPDEVCVHICTSSEKFSKCSVGVFGLLDDKTTYIKTTPETISPTHIKQSRHITVSPEVAKRLGIKL